MTAKEWNDLYPIGTRVKYYPIIDGKDNYETYTRSAAWELGDGTPIVLLHGRAGGVFLKALEVIDE